MDINLDTVVWQRKGYSILCFRFQSFSQPYSIRYFVMVNVMNGILVPTKCVRSMSVGTIQTLKYINSHHWLLNFCPTGSNLATYFHQFRYLPLYNLFSFLPLKSFSSFTHLILPVSCPISWGFQIGPSLVPRLID